MLGYQDCLMFFWTVINSGNLRSRLLTTFSTSRHTSFTWRASLHLGWLCYFSFFSSLNLLMVDWICLKLSVGCNNQSHIQLPLLPLMTCVPGYSVTILWFPKGPKYLTGTTRMCAPAHSLVDPTVRKLRLITFLVHFLIAVYFLQCL